MKPIPLIDPKGTNKDMKYRYYTKKAENTILMTYSPPHPLTRYNLRQMALCLVD